MILSFSKPEFKERILSGTKKHTIRLDATNRWKVGMMIQLWMHSPRNVTKNPHQFETKQCVSIQRIDIVRVDDYLEHTWVFIDGKRLNEDQVQQLAWNDGFNSLIDFWMWFEGGFKGKIIHWTDLKY
ncbi:MAG: ASCH domain-containing protein [Flavobacteriales bacterium]|nr:ASCH domain-containing protein [Flavobacteriales bacterium]